RIALGGVAAKPWRAREAEASLAGTRATPEAFAKAAELALADARPSGDNAFKIELARRIVARVLTLALEGTPRLMPALPAAPFALRVEVLQDDRVRYSNQPIAMVIAETLEAATEGAVLLDPQYEVEPARTVPENGERFEPVAVGVGSAARTAHGDIEAGFAA